MTRRWYEHLADEHAQRDWSERRRWSCMGCGVIDEKRGTDAQ